MTAADPTFDPDGYPTESTLRRIRRWECKSLADMLAAMDFAGRCWHWPDMWVREDEFVDGDSLTPRVRYRFSTGGWSGNELVVGAIEKNRILQAIGAWSWRRGGHYEYRFPREARSDGA